MHRIYSLHFISIGLGSVSLFYVINFKQNIKTYQMNISLKHTKLFEKDLQNISKGLINASMIQYISKF